MHRGGVCLGLVIVLIAGPLMGRIASEENLQVSSAAKSHSVCTASFEPQRRLEPSKRSQSKDDGFSKLVCTLVNLWHKERIARS